MLGQSGGMFVALGKPSESVLLSFPWEGKTVHIFWLYRYHKEDVFDIYSCHDWVSLFLN